MASISAWQSACRSVSPVAAGAGHLAVPHQHRPDRHFSLGGRFVRQTESQPHIRFIRLCEAALFRPDHDGCPTMLDTTFRAVMASNPARLRMTVGESRICPTRLGTERAENPLPTGRRTACGAVSPRPVPGPQDSRPDHAEHRHDRERRPVEHPYGVQIRQKLGGVLQDDRKGVIQEMEQHRRPDGTGLDRQISKKSGPG